MHMPLVLKPLGILCCTRSWAVIYLRSTCHVEKCKIWYQAPLYSYPVKQVLLCTGPFVNNGAHSHCRAYIACCYFIPCSLTKHFGMLFTTCHLFQLIYIIAPLCRGMKLTSVFVLSGIITWNGKQLQSTVLLPCFSQMKHCSWSIGHCCNVLVGIL